MTFKKTIMKTKLLFLLFLSSLWSYGQSIEINQITPTAVTGGVNVNLLVTTFNGAGYLSNTYSVSENTITLNVCYWFNITLPVYQMNNDFFIPLTTGGNYTLNVNIFHSSSATQCDFFANGPSATVNFLSNSVFETTDNRWQLYPNPTSGSVSFQGNSIDLTKVTVYDATGRLVHTFVNREIDFSSFNEGIYLVKMETTNQIVTQKVVVKR